MSAATPLDAARQRALLALQRRHELALDAWTRKWSAHFPNGRPPFDRRLDAAATIWQEDPRPGVCRWCGQQADTPRRRWHDACVDAYAAAQGLTRRQDGTPLLPPGRCELCDAKGTQIDHRLALACAWEEAADLRTAFMAWSIGNLRRLCDQCHKAKTHADAQRLARARRGQTELLHHHAA